MTTATPPAACEPGLAGGLRILHLEDTEADRLLVREDLRRGGVQTSELTQVASLSEAAKLPNLRAFDVAILDLHLSDRSGFETLLGARRLLPEVPIVVLTGLDEDGLGLAALSAGAQDFVGKSELGTGALTRAIRYAEQRAAFGSRAGQVLVRECLGTFATRAAHEFNNQLAVILGHASLLALSARSEGRIGTAADGIVDAARRGARLARRLLVYAGRAGGSQARCSVPEVIELSRPLLEAAVPESISLRMEVSEATMPISVGADSVRQLLTSLVLNASEAIGHRRGTITVTCHVRGAPSEPAVERWVVLPATAGAHACLEVADTGPGIAPGAEHRIFEPFYSAHGGGRGLGLSVTEGIVRSAGGGIALESAVGVGTRVCVFLPLATASRGHEWAVHARSSRRRGDAR